MDQPVSSGSTLLGQGQITSNHVASAVSYGWGWSQTCSCGSWAAATLKSIWQLSAKVYLVSFFLSLHPNGWLLHVGVPGKTKHKQSGHTAVVRHMSSTDASSHSPPITFSASLRPPWVPLGVVLKVSHCWGDPYQRAQTVLHLWILEVNCWLVDQEFVDQWGSPVWDTYQELDMIYRYRNQSYTRKRTCWFINEGLIHFNLYRTLFPWIKLKISNEDMNLKNSQLNLGGTTREKIYHSNVKSNKE